MSEFIRFINSGRIYSPENDVAIINQCTTTVGALMESINEEKRRRRVFREWVTPNVKAEFMRGRCKFNHVKKIGSLTILAEVTFTKFLKFRKCL